MKNLRCKQLQLQPVGIVSKLYYFLYVLLLGRNHNSLQL